MAANISTTIRDFLEATSQLFNHILSPLVSDRMTRKSLAITSLPARRRPATSSQWGDAGQCHITRVIRLLSARLGPRPCVSRARTPSSICARGLPPSGPADNRCRVLSRSCPAYVPCSCCDSTVADDVMVSRDVLRLREPSSARGPM